jgi:hypothetical protein
MNFVAERATRSHSFILDMEAAAAFRLFEPEGDPATWVVTRRVPEKGLLEYVCLTPGMRVATVAVKCTQLDDRRTRVHVTYLCTGLSAAGNQFVRRLASAACREFISGWERAVRQTAVGAR